jgi:hypothetical protein
VLPCDSIRILSDDERDQIAILRAAGRSMAAIARALGRAKTTISRELERNALRSGGYSPPLHGARPVGGRTFSIDIPPACQVSERLYLGFGIGGAY